MILVSVRGGPSLGHLGFCATSPHFDVGQLFGVNRLLLAPFDSDS